METFKNELKAMRFNRRQPLMFLLQKIIVNHWVLYITVRYLIVCFIIISVIFLISLSVKGRRLVFEGRLDFKLGTPCDQF